MSEKYIPRLKKVYREEIVPRLMNEFSYKNVMQVPRLGKVVLNAGLAEGMHDIKLLESVLDEFSLITGQKGVITRAKKSIANFKLRKDMPIGCKVTLRSDMAYEFLDRFISFAVPRIRDFRGVPLRGFDGRGNYTLGITEQLIFPEINYDKIVKVHGLSVTIVTTAETDKEAKALLEAFGMPFRKSN